MKRSKHSLSHYRLLTCDMGELVPVACYEVLPGDTIQHATSLLLRVSPLLAPVMHPVQVKVHHWFVPNRLIWDTWEDFITGGKDGLGNGAVPPKLNTTWVKGELGDYLGLPLNQLLDTSALPVYAYNEIWNQNYRDQDLQNEIAASSTSVQRVAWEKDYFTTARPWPQKGPDVTLPLGVQAPVRGIGAETGAPHQGSAPVNTQFFETQGGRVYPNADYFNVVQPNRQVFEIDPGTGLPRIYADLTAATATNINDVRRAFALQRYQEARAQYGSRYTEYLAFLGIRSSDSRLQRPEYLGGGKATISFSEVLRTGNETAGVTPAVIGEMKGHGIGALRSRRFRRFFEEHGLVMTLLSVRPRAMYMQGVERMWTRPTKEDYWQRELELIGQQEILNREIDSMHASPLGVFGYGDRYSEYRHLSSKICGDFRDTLNFWHMARDFATPPVLNSSFVECEPTKRIHAEQTEDCLWIMVNHSIQARRLVTKKTIGRVI